MNRAPSLMKRMSYWSETIAGYVASAIENAQLTQQLADTAVVEERNRIARELHDSVTQNLYTVATIF